MKPWIYAIYLAPYVIAVVLARYAANPWARRLVITTSAIMFSGLALVFVLSVGCRSRDFVFHSCTFISDTAANYLSLLTVFLMFGYFIISPIAALVAAVLEVVSRRRR